MRGQFSHRSFVCQQCLHPLSNTSIEKLSMDLASRAPSMATGRVVVPDCVEPSQEFPEATVTGDFLTGFAL